MEKQIIRSLMKKLVNDLSGNEKSEASQRIFGEIEGMGEFINAKCILLYYSLDDEVITHDFIKKHKDKKTILLPSIEGDELVLRKLASLTPGKFHIMESTGEVFVNYRKIDLAIIPGRAFDKDNNRLGRGKGYYDELLSRLNCYKIGICFSCQFVDKIDINEWDIEMDRVICR